MLNRDYSRTAACRRTVAVAIVLVGLMTLLSPVARAQTAKEALPLAPDKAQMVVILPSLQRVNQKIAMVNTEMGFNFPGANDMLSQLRESFGMEEGIDENRPVLIAVSGLDQTIEEEAEPRALALVPTTDYAAFAQALGGDAGGALSEVQLPDGQTGYIRQTEGYALVSPYRESVESYQAAGRRSAMARGLGALGDTYLPLGDVAAVLDVGSLSESILPKLAEARQEMERELSQADPEELGGMDVESIKGMLHAYIDAVEKVVRDAAAATVTLEVSEKGAGLSFTMQFKEGSEMAGVCNTPDEAPSMLGMLPKQPYLFAMSFDLEGSGIVGFFMDLLDRIPDNDQPMWKMLKQNIGMVKNMHGAAQTILAPKQLDLAGGGMFAAVSVVKTDDAKTYTRDYAEALRGLDGMQIPMGPMPNGQPGTMSFSSQYTQAAMQVDGVDVDQYSLRYSFPPEMMQAMGPMAPIMMALGMSGQQGYIASLDKHVIMTTSLDAQVVKEAIATVRKGNGLGSQASFDRIREHLPSAPHGEMYVSIDGLMNTGNMFLQMFGQQAIAVPEDLPPVAFWMSIEDGGVAKRLFIPMPVAQFVKETAEVTVPRMMGGGQQQPQQEGEPAPRRNPSGPPPAPFD